LWYFFIYISFNSLRVKSQGNLGDLNRPTHLLLQVKGWKPSCHPSPGAMWKVGKKLILLPSHALDQVSYRPPGGQETERKRKAEGEIERIASTPGR
jgi:hypothetical protein